MDTFSAVDKPMTILVSVSFWETWVNVDMWTDGGTQFIFPENVFEYDGLEKRGRVTEAGVED